MTVCLRVYYFASYPDDGQFFALALPSDMFFDRVLDRQLPRSFLISFLFSPLLRVTHPS